jgi:hypothetical protein
VMFLPLDEAIGDQSTRALVHHANDTSLKRVFDFKQLFPF